MRTLLVFGFLFLLSGCALENSYGVPYSVWSTLTPVQKQALIDYDAKKRVQEKKVWIWRDSAEQSEAAAVPK